MTGTDRSRAQAGFTLVEVLVAAFVIVVGVLGTLGALASGNRLTGEAKRGEQATAVGQRAIARIKALPYAQVGLASLPARESAPSPASRISVDGQSLTVGATTEPFVTGGTVSSAPERFSTGSTTGTIFRYVTRRRECQLSLGVCVDPMDSKRVTVAVWLDSARGRRAAPVFASTVVIDPNSGPLGVNVAPTANPGSGPPVSAESFFLGDTPCTASGRAPIAAAHATHDTTGSACSGSAPPDLLAPDSPPDTTTAPPDLSTDLTGRGTGPQGLALTRQTSTTSCPSGTSTQTHRWASAPLPLTFQVAGRSALSLWTKTVGGLPASATICAKLEMQTLSGSTTEKTTVATTSYHLDEWPTTPTPVAFSFANTPVNLGAIPLLAEGRLLLTLSVKSDSGADLELLYDHPDFGSLVSVATVPPS